MTRSTDTRACSACGGPAALARRPGYFDMLACPACGLRTLQRPDAVEDLSVEQSEKAYVASYLGTLSRVVRARVRYVRAIVPPQSEILDFGAGYGYIARDRKSTRL